MEELQKLEELISLLYQDKLTQYGKRLLVENIEKLQKENEELRAKWDKDTHILQNKLDYANADRIDLTQQNKELRKENEELKNKINQLENMNEFQSKDIEKAVDYTFELNKEIEIKDQIIDLMSEMLNNHDIDEDICKQMGQKENCNEFTDKENCKNCIKQYFENKLKK
jgi:predicted component of type VI protein secretion system